MSSSSSFPSLWSPRLLQLLPLCLFWHPSPLPILHIPPILFLSSPSRHLLLLYLCLCALLPPGSALSMGTIERARPRPSWAPLARQQLSWRGTAAARAGGPPVELLWLGPGPKLPDCPASSPKQAGPEPAVVLLVEGVCVCVFGLLSWLAELSVTAQ